MWFLDSVLVGDKSEVIELCCQADPGNTTKAFGVRGFF